jgi:hypothetical protein
LNGRDQAGERVRTGYQASPPPKLATHRLIYVKVAPEAA